MKTIQTFDVLHVLVGSLKAGLSVLVWSLVVILGIICSTALLFNFMLIDFTLDEANPIDARKKVFEKFGSFSRALVTVFEMTLGSWIKPLRVLQEHVSEWYGPVILVYVCSVTFAVMQVIRAVFMQQTFKVAASDEDLMIIQKDKQIKKHIRDMLRFFDDADQTGSGYVTLSEFMDIVEDPRVRTWLAAMEFDAANVDLEQVFELLCVRGDNQLSAEELVKGVGKLKGTARSVDMLMLQHRFDTLESTCIRIENRLQGSKA